MTETLFGLGMTCTLLGAFIGFLMYVTNPRPFRAGDPAVLLVLLGLALLALSIVSGALT